MGKSMDAYNKAALAEDQTNERFFNALLSGDNNEITHAGNDLLNSRAITDVTYEEMKNKKGQ